jgi:hydroxymethylbilane synthase
MAGLETISNGLGQSRPIVIGTRGSTLALAQAETVRAAILRIRPGQEVTLRIIRTTGDAIQDRPLSQVGGNGVFVRQIETELAEGRIDLAVHSAKDLPSALAPDLCIAAYLPRADARDVLVSSSGSRLDDLPAGARVGTSSPRRACQLRWRRPDLQLLDLRGNVDTRLRKLREGQYDAIVLAAAGLERLGLSDTISQWLEPEEMIPAVGQGALAVQVRADDERVRGLAAALNDAHTWAAVTAERGFLSTLGGSCALPVAAYAKIERAELTLTAMIGSVYGEMVLGNQTGPASAAAEIGVELAKRLLDQGGRRLVEESQAGAT